MTNYTNSYSQKTLMTEINEVFIEISESIKKFIYKYHWILGYF